MEAATSLKTLAMLPGVEPLFVPHLEELLRQYFRLLNEVCVRKIYIYNMCVDERRWGVCGAVGVCLLLIFPAPPTTPLNPLSSSFFIRWARTRWCRPWR